MKPPTDAKQFNKIVLLGAASMSIERALQKLARR